METYSQNKQVKKANLEAKHTITTQQQIPLQTCGHLQIYFKR